jgi:hypothetical protein
VQQLSKLKKSFGPFLGEDNTSGDLKPIDIIAVLQQFIQSFFWFILKFLLSQRTW